MGITEIEIWLTLCEYDIMVMYSWLVYSKIKCQQKKKKSQKDN